MANRPPGPETLPPRRDGRYLEKPATDDSERGDTDEGRNPTPAAIDVPSPKLGVVQLREGPWYELAGHGDPAPEEDALLLVFDSKAGHDLARLTAYAQETIVDRVPKQQRPHTVVLACLTDEAGTGDGSRIKVLGTITGDLPDQGSGGMRYRNLLPFGQSHLISMSHVQLRAPEVDTQDVIRPSEPRT